jgi:hypothetical protein
MEDKVKFVGIILVRNLWYEDHCYGVKHTGTPHKSSSAINFHKVERPKLI